MEPHATQRHVLEVTDQPLTFDLGHFDFLMERKLSRRLCWVRALSSVPKPSLFWASTAPMATSPPSLQCCPYNIWGALGGWDP